MGGVRLVDLKGSLIEASGAMVGGSVTKSHLGFSKVDRGKLEEVTKELDAAIKSQEDVSEKLAAIRREIMDIENSLGEIRSKGDQEIQVKDLDVRRKEFAAKIEVVKKDLEGKTSERDELVAKKDEVVKTINEFKTRIEELEKTKEEKGKLLLKGTKKELAGKARTLEEEVSKLQENILSLSSNRESEDKKIELLEEKKTEITAVSYTHLTLPTN